MKAKFLFAPTAALALGSIWTVSQRQSISTLEAESALLKKHIAASRSTGASADSAYAKPTPPGRTAKEKEALDWKKIAADFSAMQQGGGMGDMRAMIKLQQRLQSMTRDELVAALDEVAALDLPAESRNMLEQMLIAPLIQKDPEFALTKFIGRLEDQNGMIGWTLASAMQEWAKRDPAKAAAWFDAQIAAGKFESKSLDGKSRSRNQFEGSLIQVLLGSDPAAATTRLGALPEDQRSEVLLHHSFQPLKEEEQLAFAALVRSQVPEKDQAKTLADQASRFGGDDGYVKVTDFLNRIEATPAERTACVEQTASSKLFTISLQKTITRENLDAMREWVTAQAPESTSTVTGKALANASYNHNVRKMQFSEAADLAFEYDAAAGNGAVLTSFLDGWQAVQNKGEIRILAEKISDPKRREKILKQLK